MFTDLEGESVSSSPLSISFISKRIASFTDTTALWGDTTANINLGVDSVDNADYEWFKDGVLINSATTRFYSVDSPGMYYAKIGLPNQNAIPTDPVRVNYFKPKLNSSADNFLTGENKVRLTVRDIPGVKYEWYRNGILMPSLNDTSIAVEDIGVYNVRLNTRNGYNYSSDSISISTGIKNRPTVEIKTASLTNGNLRFEMFKMILAVLVLN